MCIILHYSCQVLASLKGEESFMLVLTICTASVVILPIVSSARLATRIASD